MRQLLLLCCLAFTASLLVAAPIPKSLRKKNTSLEGRWKLSSMNYNGQALNAGNSTQVWTITGDDMVIEDGANGVRRNNGVNYKLMKVEGDGENCVDWTIEYTNARASNYVYRGRVKFDDDAFDFVFSANGRDSVRPDAVEPGPSRYFYSFKRATLEK